MTTEIFVSKVSIINAYCNIIVYLLSERREYYMSILDQIYERKYPNYLSTNSIIGAVKDAHGMYNNMQNTHNNYC